MAGRVEGKVALVTGAGSSGPGTGIGKAISLALGAEGASVLLVDKVEDRAQETLDLLVANGGTGRVHGGDITDESQCQAMVAAAIEHFGGLDILINNAALATHHGLLDTSLDHYQQVLGVNLVGSFLMCKAAVPALQARGGGSIVNVASVAAIRDVGFSHPAYSSSKAGMLGLTIDLAAQYGSDGVRVNAVLPGSVETPMGDALIAAMAATGPTAIRGVRPNLLGRRGDAWDIARAVLFLASDDASYITGVTLPVDGGGIITTTGTATRG